MLEIGIYHPQIPQNTGTLLRVSSCLGIHVNIIGPLGFILSDTKLKRAGMDYLNTASYEIYSSFEKFLSSKRNKRLIALEISPNAKPHYKFEYSKDDIIIVGSEHSGFAPEDITKIDECVVIPMLPNRRSMNMAIATAFVLSEAMHQLNLYHDC